MILVNDKIKKILESTDDNVVKETQIRNLISECLRYNHACYIIYPNSFIVDSDFRLNDFLKLNE